MTKKHHQTKMADHLIMSLKVEKTYREAGVDLNDPAIQDAILATGWLIHGSCHDQHSYDTMIDAIMTPLMKDGHENCVLCRLKVPK
jgi:hypothetical protein